MRMVLKVADGPCEGRLVMLQAGQAVQIGRTERADFCVPHDELLSGVHFSVACESQQCVLRDLQSTNGTSLNDARVTEAQLHDGDVIIAGRTKFLVTIEITESVFNLDAVRLAIASGGAPPRPSESAETPNSAARAPVVSEMAVDPTAALRESSGLVPAERALRELPKSPYLETAVDTPSISPALMLAADAPRPYVAAFGDPDPEVRREALYAAAWSGEAWLLEVCRSLADNPQIGHWDALRLFAILGEPSDLERIVRIGRTAKLGSRRFEVSASFGHPQVVRDLLTAMESDDANTAVAAGVAFTKITGADIDSEAGVQLQPEDEGEPDEFEQEFLDEAVLPDPQLARQHWAKVKDDFAKGTRWRRGLNLTGDRYLSHLDQLDMEARWECALRSSMAGSRVERQYIGLHKY